MGGGASSTRDKEEKATKTDAPSGNGGMSRRRSRSSTAEEVTVRKTVIDGMKARARGDKYDLCVLGAGPAGMKAAVEAGARGQRVVLIDPKERIHGAPTGAHSKCLREAVLTGAKTWDMVNACISRATKLCIESCEQQLKTYHVEHLRGTAKLLDADSLEFHPHRPEGQDDQTFLAAKKVLRFDMLVIATGSKSNRFPPVPFNWPACYDSDTINNIDKIPERILIQGAGIIGLEYGLIFRKLGTEVIIVEAFDKVVPMLDISLQQACLETMRKEGVEIVLKCPIKSVTKADSHSDEAPRYKVEIGDQARVIECDCILSCCGRHGCSEGLGLEPLEPLGLKIGRGKMIQVDKNCWTGVGNIYAVGDVVGGNLATVGQAHSIRAIRCRWGSGMQSKERGKDVKPSGVWTIPELAWAGITEQKAMEDGINFGAVVVPYEHTMKGCVTNQDGFLKLIYDRDSGVALGVHLFGENSCDLVNYGAEVVNDGDTIFEMLQMVFPAVTYHELYNLAATEAKIYMRHKDAQDVQAAASWRRVKGIITNAMKKMKSDASPDEELAKVFRSMDEDSSGFISHPQMKKAMESFGLTLSDEEIHAMIREATGGEDDNNVDYEEFLKMVK